MTKKSKKPKKKSDKTRTSKEEKLFQNLFKVTQQFMKGKGFVALSEEDLKERLHIPPQHDNIFHDVLEEMLSKKMIELSRGRYMLKQISRDVVTGILRVHPRGFGFLQPDDPSLYPQDIFIPKHLTQNAIDGDTVEVLINQESVSEKGPEGKVITILSRGRTHIAGIIRAIEKSGDIVAYVPLLGIAQHVIVLPSDEFDLRVGDRLVMEVHDWGSKETETICKASQYIGHISDPSCDIKAAIEEFELKSEFPQRAIQEAQSFGSKVSLSEIKGREDLRHVTCFTIDPDTAKDFDDAISLSKDPKGNYILGVHIADVSHYVPSNSALDQEASLRCNSTYFPGFCLPMLPHELSSHLCSLKPNVNRLTISTFMHFDPNGDLLDYRISRSVIKSSKRFTYKEAKQVLDGKKKSKHSANLKLMVELCELLKRKRYERGSIEFAMPELVVLVDENGVPKQTDYISYDITHQLVEEFMLKTNETIALHLSKKGKNLTYRIHDEPAEENMKDFSLLACAFGFHLSEKPTPAELQKLFDEAMQTPYGEYLANSYIRRMRLAIYSPENIGHYGLSLSHYCHFTSPIRRYVDLVVHRILFGESDDRETLEMIADRCSEQERISAKAENNVILLKKLRLLKANKDKDPYKQYEAVVTKVKNFGFFFEVLDFMLESFLHVSELDNDFYIFEEANILLRGRRTGQKYCCGDRITVMLKDVDFISLESHWSLVLSESKPEKSKELKKEKTKPQRKPFAPTRAWPKKSTSKKNASTGKKSQKHYKKKK